MVWASEFPFNIISKGEACYFKYDEFEVTVMNVKLGIPVSGLEKQGKKMT